MKSLILIFLILFLTIFYASSYLSPNDFSNCSIRPDNSSKCKKADAIVAISGGDTDARLEKSIELFKNGWADKLIFSGAAKDKTGPSNARAMKAIALNAGVSEKSILIDEAANTTKENALNTSKIFSEEKIHSAIIVTSGYHQRRASSEFKTSSPTVEIRNFPVNDKDWSSMWWTNIRGWTLATTEITKNMTIEASNK